MAEHPSLLRTVGTKTADSKMSRDGLRYTAKPAGSPFTGEKSSSAMSCFRCGAHKPRSQLGMKRILGRCTLVCASGCGG